MFSALSYRDSSFDSDQSALSSSQHIAIVAHQDDAEIIAYSAISECFNRSDKWFSSLTLTNGSGASRGGKYQNFSDEELAHCRQQEQLSAAHLGRYALANQWSTSSSFIKQQASEAIESLYQYLLTSYQKGKIQYLYSHSPFDKHETHRAVLKVVIEATRRLKASHPDFQLILLGVEVWGSLDWLPEQYKIQLNCSDMPHLEQALIGLYDSQIDGNKGYDSAVIGRRLANATFCESHNQDQMRSVQYALDLSPLITSPERYPTMKEFVSPILEDFHRSMQSFW